MLPSVATRLASSVDGETETSSRTPIATARAPTSAGSRNRFAAVVVRCSNGGKPPWSGGVML